MLATLATLYATPSVIVPKAILYYHTADPTMFLTKVGADVSGWTCGFGSGYNASCAVIRPSDSGSGVYFDGSENMLWGLTGSGLTGDITFLLGVDVDNETSGSRFLGSDGDVGGLFQYNSGGINYQVASGGDAGSTGPAISESLQCFVAQCEAGAKNKYYVNGVHTNTAVNNYAATDYDGVCTLFSRAVPDKFSEGTLRFIGVFQGVNDTDSVNIGLWGKADLGL